MARNDDRGRPKCKLPWAAAGLPLRRDETVHHQFSTGFVEIDGQFGPVHGDHGARAEFVVEHPRAGMKIRGRGGLSVDGAFENWACRLRAAQARVPPLALPRLRATPAGRVVAGGKARFQTRSRPRTMVAVRRSDEFVEFDMVSGQFLDEPRWNRGLP